MITISTEKKEVRNFIEKMAKVEMQRRRVPQSDQQIMDSNKLKNNKRSLKTRQ